MENKKLIELIKKTQKWFYDRNLQTQNPDKQFLKLFEEIGELASGLAKKQDDVIKDSIGDIYVTEVVAENFQILEKRDNSGNQNSMMEQMPPSYASNPVDISDNDLPF